MLTHEPTAQINAAALCAAVCSADVESQNIVGYSTTTVDAAKQVALTVQFEDVSTAGQIAVKDVVKSSNPTAGSSFGTADQIWRWSNGAWQQYFLCKPNPRAEITADGWATKESAGKGDVTTDTIPAGETFFYLNKGKVTATITLAGGVKAFAATPTYEVEAAKQVFIGYPWPQKLAIAGFDKYCSNPTAGSSFGTADQIWRWGSGAWDQYFLCKPNPRAEITADGWATKDSAGKGGVTDAEINVGEGFFFLNKGKVKQTITFTNPAAE